VHHSVFQGPRIHAIRPSGVLVKNAAAAALSRIPVIADRVLAWRPWVDSVENLRSKHCADRLIRLARPERNYGSPARARSLRCCSSRPVREFFNDIGGFRSFPRSGLSRHSTWPGGHWLIRRDQAPRLRGIRSNRSDPDVSSGGPPRAGCLGNVACDVQGNRKRCRAAPS
jgi:hypothetical protein